MIVVTCRIELFLPDCHSLKDKRQIIRSLTGRVRAKINSSAAEVDFQDLWQRTVVGVAMVGSDKTVLDSQVNLIRRLVDETEGAELAAFDVDYF